MTDRDLPRRKLPRLKNYDYSQNGYYFVTICTKNRSCLLSRVGNAVPGVPTIPIPTSIGEIVLAAWERMSEIEPNIKTDCFCLMPNHIHGIIIIEGKTDSDPAERRGRRSLPEIVRAFKSATTRQFNRLVPDSMKNMLWQSSFYDEIIRSEEHLEDIRRYIDENPIKWAEDRYFLPNSTESNYFSIIKGETTP